MKIAGIEVYKVNKVRFSKVALVVMLLFLLVYTIYNTYMFYTLGVEPSTLTECVYEFCVGEAGFMAIIKVVEKWKG